MKHCDIENFRLAYHEQGTGTPVLLIHGYPLSSLIWTSTSNLLAEQGWRVIAPDLRGFRKSPPASGSSVTTMERFADDLQLLLQKIGITEKVLVVGLSMGGYIAMQFAKKYEKQLSGIVLCGTKTTADTPEIGENRRKQAAGLLDGSLSLADIADTMIPKLLSTATKERKPELVAELRNIIIGSQHVHGVAAATLGMGERSDTTEVLRQLNVPVWAVCGVEDQLTPPAEMNKLARAAKRGTFTIISDAGHLLPMEQPESFADVFAKLQERQS